MPFAQRCRNERNAALQSTGASECLASRAASSLGRTPFYQTAISVREMSLALCILIPAPPKRATVSRTRLRYRPRSRPPRCRRGSQPGSGYPTGVASPFAPDGRLALRIPWIAPQHALELVGRKAAAETSLRVLLCTLEECLARAGRAAPCAPLYSIACVPGLTDEDCAARKESAALHSRRGHSVRKAPLDHHEGASSGGLLPGRLCGRPLSREPLARRERWSGRRDSNPRHSAWEADTLPAELLPLGFPFR